MIENLHHKYTSPLKQQVLKNAPTLKIKWKSTPKNVSTSSIHRSHRPSSRSGHTTNPEPRENEILVKATSIGSNPHDEKIRDEGLFTGNKAPYILANDIAGTSTRVGPAVSRFRPGNRVFGQAGVGSLDRGSLQQYALVDADLAARIPDSLTDDAAATFPTDAMAAFVALSRAPRCRVPLPYAPPAECDAFRAERHAVVVLGVGANCGRMGV